MDIPQPGGSGAVPLIGGSLMIERFKHWLHSFLGHYPVYVRFLRWRHGADNGLVGPNTEIVIEGYPRSGNTFCVTAFEMAQGRQLRRADHLHAPAQVILAAHMGIPCLVLVREPRDAIFSYVIRFPHISIKQCLADYIRFYTAILPYRNQYVLTTFEAATLNFGRVIRKLNSRFQTTFAEFDHTPENEARCFELVQRRYEGKYGQGRAISETVHSRPSAEKAKIKEIFKQAFIAQFEAPELAALRDRASFLHATLVAEADL